MHRPKPSRALERDIHPEAKARTASGKMTGLAHRARQWLLPENEGEAVDWSSLYLPQHILGFLRQQEVHDIKSAQSFSTRSGQFEQHAGFTLLVLLEGAGTVGVDSRAFALQEGDALLIFPHQRYHYLSCANEFSWLYFTFALEEDHAVRLGEMRDAPRAVSRKARRALSNTLEAYHGAASDRDAPHVSLLLGDLIGELHEGETVDREEKNLSLAARTRMFVFERLDGEITIDEMTREFECAPSALKDEFRRAVGDTLSSFVRSARLVQAARFLREGEDPPEAVARRCGFKSLESFTEAFEGTYRVSPAAYQGSEKA